MGEALSWRRAPQNRRAFGSVDQFLTTKPLKPAPCEAIKTLIDRDDELRSALFSVLTDSDVQKGRTDHLLISVGGEIAYQWHHVDCPPHQPHLLFSISKPITGLAAECLAANGCLDWSSKASLHYPWPQASAFGDATLRAMADMEVAVGMIEGDVEGGLLFKQYRAAMGWDETVYNNVGLAAFLASVPKGEPHDLPRFQYSSATTDAFGATLEAITGKNLADLWSETVLKPAGCAGPAYCTIDKVGLARAAGGICLTAYDLLRIGLTRIFPLNETLAKAWLSVTKPKEQASWQRGDFNTLYPNGHYRSYWYHTGAPDHAIVAMGIHGQWLWIVPSLELVVVRLASEDLPEDEMLEQHTLNVLRVITDTVRSNVGRKSA